MAHANPLRKLVISTAQSLTRTKSTAPESSAEDALSRQARDRCSCRSLSSRRPGNTVRSSRKITQPLPQRAQLLFAGHDALISNSLGAGGPASHPATPGTASATAEPLPDRSIIHHIRPRLSWTAPGSKSCLSIPTGAASQKHGFFPVVNNQFVASAIHPSYPCYLW